MFSILFYTAGCAWMSQSGLYKNRRRTSPEVLTSQQKRKPSGHNKQEKAPALRAWNISKEEGSPQQDLRHHDRMSAIPYGFK